ncbi:TPA: flippase [Photobacterium damselae]
MLDRILIKNIASLFSIKASGLIIPLITVPYLVRTLGVEGYGYLGFSLAIIQYSILFVNYGFDLSATSSIAKLKNDKKAISKIFWSVITIRILASFLSLILILIISLHIPSLYEVIPIILSSFIMVIGTALFPQWLFQGKEQLGLISTARSVLQVLTIPLLFYFVNGHNDIWIAAIINGFPFLGIAIISMFIISSRNWISWVKPSLEDIKKEYKDGWHIFISTAAINLYTSSVTVILGFLSGPVSVGYFVAADKLIKATLGVYGPVSNAFYPRINAAISVSKENAKKLIIQLSKIQIILALFLSIGVYFFSDLVVQMLYGDEFKTTISLLKILCWLPIVICFSNILGIQIMIPFGYKKQFSKVLISSGVLSLLLLIPLVLLYGEFGAAYSVVITECIVTLLMYWSVCKNKILN